MLSIPVIVPTLLGEQENPIDRLRTALPADIADEVIASVTDATSRGLPGHAIADRALEAIARGRSARKVSAAVQAFATDLARGRAALQHAGRTPDATEIEAAATAKELGVSGATISALASSAPSGRSLAVPLAVIGALVNGGLTSGDALKAVLDRLRARANDGSQMPREAGRSVAAERKAGDAGGSGRRHTRRTPEAARALKQNPTDPEALSDVRSDRGAQE